MSTHSSRGFRLHFFNVNINLITWKLHTPNRRWSKCGERRKFKTANFPIFRPFSFIAEVFSPKNKNSGESNKALFHQDQPCFQSASARRWSGARNLAFLERERHLSYNKSTRRKSFRFAIYILHEKFCIWGHARLFIAIRITIRTASWVRALQICRCFPFSVNSTAVSQEKNNFP